jgi:hypothetical protein
MGSSTIVATKSDVCLFAEETLSPFEFYALFTQDKPFRDWIVDHALQKENCSRCRELINARHLVASEEEFWGDMDMNLGRARKKFYEFQCEHTIVSL